MEPKRTFNIEDINDVDDAVAVAAYYSIYYSTLNLYTFLTL